MTQQLTELIPVPERERKKLEKLFGPLNDVVIVAVDDQEKKTPGGILLPESTNSNMQARSGTVIAHGPGARSPVTGDRVPLSVKVGDRVVFGQYAGNDLKYGGYDMKAMREPDILTLVQDDDALQPEGLQVRKEAASKGGKKKAKRKTAKAS